MKKQPEANNNLLDYIPIKAVQSEHDSDGKVVILKPKFSQKLIVKYVLPRMKRPNYRITLNDFVTAVWNHCDGRNTVADIATQLKKDFGETIEPVHERLGMFIRTLKTNRFIEYQML